MENMDRGFLIKGIPSVAAIGVAVFAVLCGIDYFWLSKQLTPITILAVSGVHVLFGLVIGVYVLLSARQRFKLEQMQDLAQDIEAIIAGARQLTEISQNAYQSAFSKASELEEITVAMDQFSSQINRIAENTNTVNQLAAGMSQATDSGAKQMDEMLIAIQTIGESSRKISNVIQSIDGIAFQTHLLALNATIEA
ncbi:MAG: hypothetical protein EHM45_18720, partial [Desulfobacteraceae bacterium]